MISLDLFCFIILLCLPSSVPVSVHYTWEAPLINSFSFPNSVTNQLFYVTSSSLSGMEASVLMLGCPGHCIELVTLLVNLIHSDFYELVPLLVQLHFCFVFLTSFFDLSEAQDFALLAFFLYRTNLVFQFEETCVAYFELFHVFLTEGLFRGSIAVFFFLPYIGVFAKFQTY